MQKIKYKKGLTFIELIVVVSIFSVIAGVILFNYRSFETNLKLQNTADDVALFIRKTQSESTSGVLNSVFSPGTAFEESEPPSYCIFFSSTLSSSFDRFADFSPKNGLYDMPVGGITGVCPSGECLERLTINSQDVFIKDVCAVVGAGGEEDCKIDELHILFKRPFPNPSLVCIKNDPDPETVYCFGAKIVIASTNPSIKERTVHIWNTGQISTE